MYANFQRNPNWISQLMCNGIFAHLCKIEKGSRGALQQAALFTLLCASLTTFASTALAPEGTFVPTGSLNTARIDHTVTLLNNGMVLVAGGDNFFIGAIPSTNFASAELYDPATGTFTLTGSMATARDLQTATLLNNGKVLVVGGIDNSSALPSAELYDPATGTFTATGSMATARNLHTATLLNNGKVLVVGGEGGNISRY